MDKDKGDKVVRLPQSFRASQGAFLESVIAISDAQEWYRQLDELNFGPLLAKRKQPITPAREILDWATP